MAIKIARGCIQLIIVLMIAECCMAVFATPRSTDFNYKSIGSKSSKSILSVALLAETEEEKGEEEGNRSCTIELEDFTKITCFLSKIHTPQRQFVLIDHRNDHQPPLFELFCVFII
jgi:hypothetical protein